jgi:hypothetical protein
MPLSETDIRRFDKLDLQNSDAVVAAIGSAAVLHWQHIPADVQAMIVRTADLLQPIHKHPEVPDHRR